MLVARHTPAATGKKQMPPHQPSRPRTRFLYFLLGIAEALVGAWIAAALEFNFLGIGPIIGGHSRSGVWRDVSGRKVIGSSFHIPRG
jgi:hypothetical protein